MPDREGAACKVVVVVEMAVVKTAERHLGRVLKDCVSESGGDCHELWWELGGKHRETATPRTFVFLVQCIEAARAGRQGLLQIVHGCCNVLWGGGG